MIFIIVFQQGQFKNMYTNIMKSHNFENEFFRARTSACLASARSDFDFWYQKEKKKKKRIENIFS